MGVNDLRSQSEQKLWVEHGLIDICAKFQVPISFLTAKAHKIIFMQKKCQEWPPTLISMLFVFPIFSLHILSILQFSLLFSHFSPIF